MDFYSVAGFWPSLTDNQLVSWDNRPYRLITFTQWPRFRAKHLLKFPAQCD